MRLSISRTPPTHTARASSVGAAHLLHLRPASRDRAARRTRAAPAARRAITAAARSTTDRAAGLAAAPRPPRPRRARAARRPPPAAPRPTSSRLRLDSARPSASRTVGTPTISMPKSRSAVMRRITASCCQSFSPNTATCGRTAWNSFVTTVVTPRKCPGRVRAAERLGEPRHLDGRGEALGVHGARRRRVDRRRRRRRRTGAASSSSVPRIALEVVAPVELHRIHEDRHDDALGLRVAPRAPAPGGPRAARPWWARARCAGPRGARRRPRPAWRRGSVMRLHGRHLSRWPRPA